MQEIYFTVNDKGKIEWDKASDCDAGLTLVKEGE
jgi:hypothetical protein